MGVIIFASLACNLPTSGSGSPPTAAPMSDEEFQQLEERMKQTLESSSGEVTVTFTEQQINSIITAKLASENEQIITDPVVRLTNGRMEVYGKLPQAGIPLDAKMVLKPGIDPSGNPKLDVEDVSMNGLPVPDELKDQVGNLIDQAFQEYLTSQNQGFKTSSITIEEGKMIVTGTLQQP
jgi:uncharacterized protein YpmS